MASLRDILMKVVPPIVKFCTGGGKDKPLGERSRMGVLIEDVTIPSAHLMGGTATYSIYLPSPNSQPTTKPLPLLILLHGIGDNNRSWERKGWVTELVDEAWREGVCGPFILVMPKAWNSFYVDGNDFFDGAPGHDYETFFREELLPHIEASYPVDPSRIVIAGNSMGGYGALRFAFLDPQKYRLSYCMSAASEGIGWQSMVHNVPPVVSLTTPNSQPTTQTPPLILDCGWADPVALWANLKTHRKLRRLGIDHLFTLHAGSHTYRFWRRSFKRLLNHLSKI